ncbi:MAG: AI-2E family transporter, partial [Elusimicrobiales bacterium]|nr:AI-2E family transporter [Elusimicrobiales bacterium]
MIPCFIAAVILYLVVITRQSLLPFILSAALAYVLNPLVRYFEVRGFKRYAVVIGLYIAFAVAVAVLGYIFVNFVSAQFLSFYENWPSYVEKIQIYFQAAADKAVGKYPFLEQVLDQLQLQQRIVPVVTSVPQYVLGALPALSFLFLVPFISFFMLIGGDSVINYFLNHIPSRRTELFLHILSRIDISLGNYLRGMLTEAFMLFLIALLGLTFMKINYAAVLAIIIGLSGLIPYLGAFVGAVIASIVAYVQFGAFMPVLKIIMFFVCIRFFDDWFMQPYIMKKAVELNPALIVFALMAGWEVAGFWGIVFSIPVTCILKELLFISVEVQEAEFNWKPKPQPVRTSI